MLIINEKVLAFDPEESLFNTNNILIDIIEDHSNFLSNHFEAKKKEIKNLIIKKYNNLIKEIGYQTNNITMSIFQTYSHYTLKENKLINTKVEKMIWESKNLLINYEMDFNKEKIEYIEKLKRYDKLVVITTGYEDFIRKQLKEIEIKYNIEFDINVLNSKSKNTIDFLIGELEGVIFIDNKINFDFNKEILNKTRRSKIGHNRRSELKFYY